MYVTEQTVLKRTCAHMCAHNAILTLATKVAGFLAVDVHVCHVHFAFPGLHQLGAVWHEIHTLHGPGWWQIIIIDNFSIALFSGVPKLTVLYILQHFLSFTNIIQLYIYIIIVTVRIQIQII